MSESRGPVRHGALKTARDRSQSSPDLQSTFATLARRAKLPTGPDARPGEVLRAAGLPLLMAALMTGAHPVSGDLADTPVTSAVPDAGGWTVTPLEITVAPDPTTPVPVVSTPAVPAPAPVESAPAAAPAEAPAVAAAAPVARRRSTASRRGTPARAASAAAHATAAEAKRASTHPAADAERADTKRADTKRADAERARAGDATRADTTRAAVAAKARAPQSSTRAAKEKAPSPRRTAPTESAHVYVVQPDDSLLGISRMVHVRLHELLVANGLHLESVIHPGDRLTVPVAMAASGGPGSPAVPGRTYPPEVVAAARANRAALARRTVPSRREVQALVRSTALAHHVDPALALGVAYLESGLQQRVVSPANAVGVMQVVPSSGRWASDLTGRPLDLLDARDNITAGVTILHALLAATSSQSRAVAGYYQGLTSVERHGMFDDTRRYVASVLRLRARFAQGTVPPTGS